MKLRKAKKKKILIVDGYNIINGWEELARISKDDLETSREKLIDYMIEYSKYTGEKTVIVFDAYNVKNSSGSTEKRSDTVSIVYTRENQTADSYIEKYIAELDDRHNTEMRVATSDFAEQQIVLGKGGSRVSAREMYLDVMQSKEKIGRKKSTHGKTVQRNSIIDHIDEATFNKLESIRRK